MALIVIGKKKPQLFRCAQKMLERHRNHFTAIMSLRWNHVMLALYFRIIKYPRYETFFGYNNMSSTNSVRELIKSCHQNSIETPIIFAHITISDGVHDSHYATSIAYTKFGS